MNNDPKYSAEQKRAQDEGLSQAIKFLITHDRIKLTYVSDLIYADMKHVEETGYSIAPPF